LKLCNDAAVRIDLAAAAFVVLREQLFDPDGEPIPFGLRDKRNTQDDPFDEWIVRQLAQGMPSEIKVATAAGPLISPDMVVAAPRGVREIREHRDDLGTTEAVGIEVKKLDRARSGLIARPSGIDYNTTPPSRTISVVYEGEAIELPGFYLFACLEPASGRRRYRVSALALSDGGVLNEDVDLYRARTGIRKKEIGLGSFGDGLDRQRPMLVFANPLGWSRLDRAATLIHRRPDLASEPGLVKLGTIERTNPERPSQAPSPYTAYRYAPDVAGDRRPFEERDPFPSVRSRSEDTQARGRFHLEL
jgi:hypothetical protein